MYKIINKLLVFVITAVIRIYKILVSPFLPKACRYYPTCSQYAVEALHKHGIVKGVYLSVKRILRCNPFFSGGHDPVP